MEYRSATSLIAGHPSVVVGGLAMGLAARHLYSVRKKKREMHKDDDIPLTKRERELLNTMLQSASNTYEYDDWFQKRDKITIKQIESVRNGTLKELFIVDPQHCQCVYALTPDHQSITAPDGDVGFFDDWDGIAGMSGTFYLKSTRRTFKIFKDRLTIPGDQGVTYPSSSFGKKSRE